MQAAGGSRVGELAKGQSRGLKVLGDGTTARDLVGSGCAKTQAGTETQTAGQPVARRRHAQRPKASGRSTQGPAAQVAHGFDAEAGISSVGSERSGSHHQLDQGDDLEAAHSSRMACSQLKCFCGKHAKVLEVRRRLDGRRRRRWECQAGHRWSVVEEAAA